ncbi:ubiquitin-like-specific protease 1 isoform X2 [Hordeum vulgare subsp. vulgare]|uniref:ubiquitin-like-specific protease 1 isoform X2 n=1 Tax=Hordeum vulgare subsp. vulgare TaxID=112509 RepID=UPI000B48683E|nr:ubiquitin-like-specific protease 1 isoform X2 [Hordeum vulgare subsp. vulgare]
MPPTLSEEIDDITDPNIVEDLDNRPSKRAKIAGSCVLESKPISATMFASSPDSESFESIVRESDNQMDRDPLPSPPSPSSSTLSYVLPLHDVKEPDSPPSPSSSTLSLVLPLHDVKEPDSPPSPSSSTLSPVLPLHDVKEPDSNKEIKGVRKYDYLPRDYTLTDHDICAHITIESSLRKQELVRIDGSIVIQNQLMCLLDEKDWVNDDVIDAYICCIKDQIHVQNGFKVYFESPFIISLLKRDGTIGIQQNSSFITEIVRKYMKHDMIELPINISNTHWYLVILNTKNMRFKYWTHCAGSLTERISLLRYEEYNFIWT